MESAQRPAGVAARRGASKVHGALLERGENRLTTEAPRTQRRLADSGSSLCSLCLCGEILEFIMADPEIKLPSGADLMLRMHLEPDPWQTDVLESGHPRVLL